MAKAYRAYLPEQDLLLPPSLRDWLPENHLAYFVSDVVDQLDLSAIESVYEKEERGQPPYHPRMMTKILLYGYSVGVFSSRQMQKKLVEDVGFRMLAILAFPSLAIGAWLIVRNHPKMFALWGLSLSQKSYYDPRKF